MGATGDPCSETYGGEAPFSEAETTALRRAMMSKGSPVLAYVSVHCCAAAVLSSPDSFSGVVAAAVARAMSRRSANGTARIRHGTVSAVLGGGRRRFGGGALAWASSVAQVALGLEAEGFHGRRRGMDRFDVEHDEEEARRRVDSVLDGIQELMKIIVQRMGQK